MRCGPRVGAGGGPARTIISHRQPWVRCTCSRDTGMGATCLRAQAGAGQDRAEVRRPLQAGLWTLACLQGGRCGSLWKFCVGGVLTPLIPYKGHSGSSVENRLRAEVGRGGVGSSVGGEGLGGPGSGYEGGVHMLWAQGEGAGRRALGVGPTLTGPWHG